MRLFLAEKPSLARAIAEALPGPKRRGDGYIACGDDDVVAWCAGHILELATPDTYDPAYKRWSLADLPIIPSTWRLNASAPDLLRNIQRLLPRARRVVHAGDPDREGQLLVDEVLDFLGYHGPVDRLLVSDLNPDAVRKALADMRPNDRYRGLYEAGLARQRADWLYGINLTRLYTLLGRAGGYGGVLSVGRVQTPVLGLVVRRDREIEAFRPTVYFAVRAEVRCAAGAFTAAWLPSDSARAALDDAGRLVSRDHALGVQTRVRGRPAVVARCVRERKVEAPPLPYSLPELQIDAGRRFGFSPKQTLDAAQALYEMHRLLTYPRSDCSYLPEGHHGQAPAVIAALAGNLPALAPHVRGADRSRRSRAWNDKKVTAHHALVPTVVRKPVAVLSITEQRVYELVARRYLAQFLPAFEFHETKIEIEAAGERFVTTGRQTIAEGWTVVCRQLSSEQDTTETDDGSDQSDQQHLPLLDEGTAVTVERVTIVDRRTAPPRRFTAASLIQAMTGIARFVEDPAVRKVLSETDGLGTPATQAHVIETLFDRHFIERQGRHIASTDIGRALISALPDSTTRPDMTALWEAAMRDIAAGHARLPDFLGGVADQLQKLVREGRAQGRVRVAARLAPTPIRRPRRGCRASVKASARGGGD